MSDRLAIAPEHFPTIRIRGGVLLNEGIVADPHRAGDGFVRSTLGAPAPAAWLPSTASKAMPVAIAAVIIAPTHMRTMCIGWRAVSPGAIPNRVSTGELEPSSAAASTRAASRLLDTPSFCRAERSLSFAALVESESSRAVLLTSCPRTSRRRTSRSRSVSRATPLPVRPAPHRPRRCSPAGP